MLFVWGFRQIATNEQVSVRRKWMNEVMNMGKRGKTALAALLGIALVMPYAYLVYSATLKQRSYESRIVVGEGNLPDLDFGFFTANGTEVTRFDYTGLVPQSVTEFSYTLKQKTAFNITVYIRWGYSCLPISYLNLEMKWNGANWAYTDAMTWRTPEDVNVTFRILVGDMDNTEWQFNQIFTVSTTP
jgi:hypothetical protein